MGVGEPVIRLEDVKVQWDGRHILRDVNLEIHKGESLLVPVNVKVKLNGNIEILRTTI